MQYTYYAIIAWSKIHYEAYTLCRLPGDSDPQAFITKLIQNVADYKAAVNLYSTKEKSLLERLGYTHDVEVITGKQYKDRGGRFPSGVDPKKHDIKMWEQRQLADEWNAALAKEASEKQIHIRKQVEEMLSEDLKEIEKKFPFLYKHTAISMLYELPDTDYGFERKVFKTSTPEEILVDENI